MINIYILIATIIITIILFVIIYFLFFDDIYDVVNDGRVCYISLTTIPDRIKSKWFIDNIKNMIQLFNDDKFKIFLYVPVVSSKNVNYEIPQELYDLQSDKFMIKVIDKDYGPITKIIPILIDKNVDDNSPIIIIDDDIIYKNFFPRLRMEIMRNPDAISTMCNSKIMGYKSYGFIKNKLMNISDTKHPEICFTIDDDVIEYFVKKNNMRINIVNHCDDHFCNIDLDKTDSHPEWTELNNIDEGKRDHKRKLCYLELDKIFSK